MQYPMLFLAAATLIVSGCEKTPPPVATETETAICEIIYPTPTFSSRDTIQTQDELVAYEILIRCLCGFEGLPDAEPCPVE